MEPPQYNEGLYGYPYDDYYGYPYYGHERYQGLAPRFRERDRGSHEGNEYRGGSVQGEVDTKVMKDIELVY